MAFAFGGRRSIQLSYGCLPGRNCLRSAYVNFSRVERQERGPRKSLFLLPLFASSLSSSLLTSAFGGQRSIQLSYGCWPGTEGLRTRGPDGPPRSGCHSPSAGAHQRTMCWLLSLFGGGADVSNCRRQGLQERDAQLRGNRDLAGRSTETCNWIGRGSSREGCGRCAGSRTPPGMASFIGAGGAMRQVRARGVE